MVEADDTDVNSFTPSNNTLVGTPLPSRTDLAYTRFRFVRSLCNDNCSVERYARRLVNYIFVLAARARRPLLRRFPSLFHPPLKFDEYRARVFVSSFLSAVLASASEILTSLRAKKTRKDHSARARAFTMTLNFHRASPPPLRRYIESLPERARPANRETELLGFPPGAFLKLCRIVRS